MILDREGVRRIVRSARNLRDAAKSEVVVTRGPARIHDGHGEPDALFDAPVRRLSKGKRIAGCRLSS